MSRSLKFFIPKKTSVPEKSIKFGNKFFYNSREKIFIIILKRPKGKM